MTSADPSGQYHQDCWRWGWGGVPSWTTTNHNSRISQDQPPDVCFSRIIQLFLNMEALCVIRTLKSLPELSDYPDDQHDMMGFMRLWETWWRLLDFSARGQCLHGGLQKKKSLCGVVLFSFPHVQACLSGGFFSSTQAKIFTDHPSATFIWCHTSLAEFHGKSCSFCFPIWV